MKKKNVKIICLKKQLIANMTAYQAEALKGGTRPQTDDFDSVELTICPGKLHCENNLSE